MSVAPSHTTDESQIRVLIDDRIKAVCGKDVDALVANHAPEILTFDVINPLQNNGVEAVKRRAEQWFSSFDGPLDYAVRDLRITRGEDVAFCHFLNQVRGRTTDGAHIDMWWRVTLCCRRIDNRWQITHEHDSVPFDMNSGKASLHLGPEA